MDSIIFIKNYGFLIKDLGGKFDFSTLDTEFANCNFEPNATNLISTDMKILNKESLKPFKDILSQEASDFLRNAYNFKNFERLEVTHSWFNKSTKGESHHKHMHPYSVVSGVVFLDDLDDNFNLFIHMKNQKIPGTFDNSGVSINLKGILVKHGNYPDNLSVKNHVFMFLSDVDHSVDPILNNVTRRTLAFNTFFKGRVGDQLNDLSSIEY